MNPNQSSNQNPASTSAVQQVNPVMNQQMFNGNVGGLFPNNMPIVAPPGFMNFPNQPFQFPNGIGGFNPQQNFIPFPVNQFNPSQQQPGQFFAHNSMNPIVYQNLSQLLHLQNSQCPPAGFPMFPNPVMNVMNPQNPGFLMNQQFGMANGNGPVQRGTHGPQNMGQQLQGNPFLPGASGSVQPQQPQNLHAAVTNFQNQIPQGMAPQNQAFFPNQMFGMAGPMQNVSQGQPGFVSSMMDVNASRQMVNNGQTSNSSPALTNFEESQHKNFTGNKTYDPSNKGSKFHKHMKQKFGNHKGNMNKEGNLEADLVARNFTNFEKKVPSLTYTEQEIKEWREARKKNYPTNGEKHKEEQTLPDVAMLRRQQLKEILAKQAELGCEVADISGSYLSSPENQNPREKKRERQQQYKKGKFHNKRGRPFQDGDRIGKKARSRNQNSFKGNHQTKPHNREPSLLQKLLTRDIKRDKTHLLQVLRFMTANSFFTGESLRFPSVIVRDTNVDVASKETTCSVVKVEEEEGEIID